MIKTHLCSTTVVVSSSRQLLVPTALGRLDIHSAHTAHTSSSGGTPPTVPGATAKMSTAATVSLPPPPARIQQPLHRHRPKEPVPNETEVPGSAKAMSNSRFPLAYSDAVHQWWHNVTPSVAERNVLNCIPFLREATSDKNGALQDIVKTDPFGPRVWKSTMVQLSGKNRALNEYSIERVGEENTDTLVMLHGYGAGLGFFYKNFEPLSRAPGWKLYALDMLGMGNSTRPNFRIQSKDPQGKIIEAENWFIDALEEWRKIRKIEKFTLLGHSLGGYLAVSYALKYPGHLNKLILASPVGIPEDPWAVNADLPEPEESTMEAEFTQDQESLTRGNSNADENAAGSDNNNFFNARDKKAAAAAAPGKTKAKATSTTPPKRPIPGWLIWLWDANVSPFSLVRLTGPLGPRFVSGWTSRRFNHLPEDEAAALHTYVYNLFRQRGSGEYALAYILAPGAYARRPVIRRIQDVGRQVVTPATESAPAVRETGFPVVMMYGDNDWMDAAGGIAAEEKIRQRVVQALLRGTDEEKRRENGSARTVIVPRAGHHLYIDNPDEFNEVVRKEMDQTREWGLKQRAMA